MKHSSLKIAAACLLVGVAVSGCVLVPAPVEGEVVAYTAPPAVPYEVIGVAPAAGYFWIGGAWFWEGGRYMWYPGHWEAPRPGYGWVPHRWRRVGNGWRMQPGHWEERPEGRRAERR